MWRGLNRIYEKGVIQEAGRWAHVRRKCYDLRLAHASPVAAEAIARIGQIYAIESEIRARPPDERRQVRQARARPVLDSFQPWLRANLAELSKKSDFTAAMCTNTARTAKEPTAPNPHAHSHRRAAVWATGSDARSAATR